MAVTTDIGRRIELVSLDPHFHGISIGLYRQERDGGAELLVYTYSGIEGAQQRVEFVARAMVILGGVQPVEGTTQAVRFPCGAPHHLASKRLFLEACKLPPGSEIEPRPLTILDKKSSANMTVASLGKGVYQLSSEGESDMISKRRSAIGGGLVKLAQMERVEGEEDRVAFSCGQPHDELVGLLLVRALNVRAFEREQVIAASRGQLFSPSAQQS